MTKTIIQPTIADYQKAHAARLPLMPWDAESWSDLEYAAFLCAESGELSNKCVKIRRGHTVDKEEVEEEFADVLACLCILANRMDVDLEEVSRKKFNKVSDRWDVDLKL